MGQCRTWAGDVQEHWQPPDRLRSAQVQHFVLRASSIEQRAPWRASPILQSVCSQPLELFFLFPAASFCCSLHPGQTLCAVDGAWEQFLQQEGAQSVALAKQSQQAFVYASAALVAKSSLKTRHKEGAEELEYPQPSPLLPDLSRLPPGSSALSTPAGQPGQGAWAEQRQPQEQPGCPLFA